MLTFDRLLLLPPPEPLLSVRCFAIHSCFSRSSNVSHCTVLLLFIEELSWGLATFHDSFGGGPGYAFSLYGCRPMNILCKNLGNILNFFLKTMQKYK